MNKQNILLGVTAGVCLAVGGVGGYFFARHRLGQEYDQRLMEEIRFSEHYNKTNKTGEFATPESAVAALIPPEVAEALETYSPENDAEVLKKNIFEAPRKDLIYAKPAKVEHGPIDLKKPYPVSQAEYLENELEYPQETVTWYINQQVLVDTYDEILDNVDEKVGLDNLKRFGMFDDADPNVIHVRNDRLAMDFEIIKSEEDYSSVIGLEV